MFEIGIRPRKIRTGERAHNRVYYGIGYLVAGSLIVAASGIYAREIVNLGRQMIKGDRDIRTGISFSPRERADYNISSRVTFKPINSGLQEELNKERPFLTSSQFSK